MILGANQPYFLPYLCYFQLINAVDKFLIADDFQYMRHHWINRNLIYSNNRTKYIILKINHATPNKNINELYTLGDQSELIKSVKAAYSKAPFFSTIFPMLEEILYFPKRNLSGFLINSLKRVCDYLGITTPLLLNSERNDDTPLRMGKRVIHLCHAMGADTYINAIGGVDLYRKEDFSAEGIDLKFLKGELPPYKQMRTQQFVPALSILDVMMNVDRGEIRRMLNQYTLI